MTRYDKTLLSLWQPQTTTAQDHSDATRGKAYLPSTVQSHLKILMNEAGYNTSVQERLLLFCSRCITPYLGPDITGPQPRQWRSFMTDDFTPLEYSWSWEKEPKIRFSVEPVGAEAGGPSDIFNRERPFACARKLRDELKGSNWSWFDSFADSFYNKNADSHPTNWSEPSSPTTISLALELGRTGNVMCKAYLVPVLAEQTGVTRLSVLSRAIDRVRTSTLTIPAFASLEEYLHYREDTMPLHIVGIAIDCVDPALSRLKVYLRATETSFDSVCSTLTLGGTHTAWTLELLRELKELWYLVLGLDHGFSSSESLPQCNHDTGGVLYNVDIHAAAGITDTKLYIPVKHYGENDDKVLRRLVGYFERHGRAEPAVGFVKAIRSLGSYRDLRHGLGLQTYISCSVKDRRLSLTSYISPQLHCWARWTN